ncbi:hypothetical protein ESZ50_08055 [Weissella muntiaci]|uniref:Baseplate upper protein immunoglobulin like domain-containing protein n=1 Tax=Weissella muntiaci TaxID=2508881 RepID=A0A6C2C551_9LACO|nr:hypothetical protein [Weissella muntiaci]TYC48822.1 hypothetical protein ESZ50_08055 [Weissella muntiaci]
MAQWFFPFQDIGGDRTYSDADFALFFTHLFTNGVFINVGNALQVKAMDTPAMRIRVLSGAANINGRQFMNTTEATLDVPVASNMQDRVDSVVLQLDLSNRLIQLVYKSGTTSVVRDDFIYEVQIATVKVLKNSSTVTSSAITDTRSNNDVGGYASPFEKVDVSGLEDQYRDMLQQVYTSAEENLNSILEEARQTAADGKTEQENSLQSMYDAFQKWFSGIQASLGDDVATNLQNQINELKPSVDTGITFSHEFDGYPLVNAWTWEYGLGMVGLGDEPDGLFGGSNVEIVNVRVVYLNRESLRIFLPDSLQMLSPNIVDQGDGKYLLSQGHRSVGMSIENNGFKG